MSYNYLPLDNKTTTLGQLQNLLDFNQQLSITFGAHEKIQYCRDYLDKKIAGSEDSFYGINTGFGNMCNVKISGDNLEQLQNNLLKSHACGMGDYVPIDIVKLMMALKIKSLSYGHSGVQIDTVNRLVDMFNQGVFPVIYTQGSLGASGDLAPLSHLALPLIGEGEVWLDGKICSAKMAMEKFGWQPIHLKSKEGLALINGTQFMGAYGVHNLNSSLKLIQWANAIAAISFDAFDCTTEPLTSQIHAIRPHNGQIKVAETMRHLLEGSEIAAQKKAHVQDPYSFRCIPQVHGATSDVIDYVSNIFSLEINSVTDNPNVFPDDDLILSGGNFHGQPLALSLDYLAIAMSELASISERRIYQLIGGLRDLPILLTQNSGLNSGFMIPQYTAASIVSENKQLCTPASVDTIPSSNNQEDHVSMGANAATKCKRVVDNIRRVLAIELMVAAQAIEFRSPLRTSPVLNEVLRAYRGTISFNTNDRFLHDDMQKTLDFITKNSAPIL